MQVALHGAHDGAALAACTVAMSSAVHTIVNTVQRFSGNTLVVVSTHLFNKAKAC
jgi:aromatic ring-opening dioxygenase catalytic subunit (LigB family)